MKKKILITSGGTTEHIDDVRVLTNTSTGAMGYQIADRFASHPEYEVHYVHTPTALKAGLEMYEPKIFFHVVTDVASLMVKMAELVPQMDVVIHAMAVSDFGFKPLHEKLKSNDPDTFIESLRERIILNPKVISYIKTWNPKTFLVSFKFEVGLKHVDLIKVARESMEKNKCDLVVANDLNEMNKAGEHIAYITSDKYEIRAKGKYQIAYKLWDVINTAVDLS